MKYYKHVSGDIWQTDGKQERCLYTTHLGKISDDWHQSNNMIYETYNYTEITEEDAFLELL